jgi:hypothetical protein
MPYPHSIRLRGPWQFEPLVRSLAIAGGQSIERHEDLPSAGRATVPSDWGETLGIEFRGRVRYRRAFNPPASLDPHERLWLVVEGVDARGVVSLNGVRLGEVPGYAVWSSFDITHLVGQRNELSLDVELPAGDCLRPGREQVPGGPIGEVRLEVRSQSFLDSLALWSVVNDGEQRFVVEGRVEGHPTGTPTAVILGGYNRELAYVETHVGERFETTFAADDFPRWTPARPVTAPIGVKLIEGGESVWQQIRQTAHRGDVDQSEAVQLSQILSDADYCRFDREGTTVIQSIPQAWADHVCPRLAHHPSIVAWSAAINETAPSIASFGRLWV